MKRVLIFCILFTLILGNLFSQQMGSYFSPAYSGGGLASLLGVASLLGGFVIFIVLVFLFSNAAFTCWVAIKKGYSGIWFILGLFFGLVALIAVGFAPEKRNSLKTEKEKQERTS